MAQPAGTRRPDRTARCLVVVAVTAALAAAGCSSAPSTASSGSAENAGAQEKFVIGFQQPLGGQPWREMGLATLQNLAGQPEYADKVELKIVRTQDNDPAQQAAAMRNLIAEGVDAILFDPASPTGANPVIAQAKAQGIPVIANGGPVASEDAYIVSTDWVEAGRIGAQWLADNLEGSKNVVVLEGFKGVPINEDAMPIVRKTLEDAGAKIIAQDTNGWDEATAQQNMAAILQSHDDIGGVYSFLTGGQGVPEAFAQAGRDFVPVVGGSGYNGEACTVAKYAAKGLTADLVSGQPAIYAKGLEQAVKLLEGEKIPREQYFPPLDITTDEAPEHCIADRPPLFAIGFEFPGLELPLEQTLTHYKG